MALFSTTVTSTSSAVLRVVLVVLLAAVVLVSCAFFFAYGLEPRMPDRADVPGLHAEAFAGVGEDGLVIAEGTDAEDAFAALGYAHATQYAWTMTLWRAAALGQLAQWQGDTLLALDRLATTLDFQDGAARSWDGLDSLSRAHLAAYARGVNASLGEEAVMSSRQMLLSRAEPEAWEPEHTLAIERLLAWLATSPPAASLSPEALAEEPGLADFAQADRRLRSALHLYGMDESYAALLTDSTGTHLFARLAYGSSATPYVVPTALRIGGAQVLGASFPGVPALLMGQTSLGETLRSFALLPSGEARIERIAAVPLDSLEPGSMPITYRRIVSASGDEVLVANRRIAEGVLLTEPRRPEVRADSLVRDSSGTVRAVFRAPPPTAVADSAWVLRWSGLSAGSDLAAWHGLLGLPALGDAAAPFALVRADGLAWDEATGTRRLGDTGESISWDQDGRSGTLVSPSVWAEWLAAELQRTDSTRLDRSEQMTDVHSAWAEAWVPGFTALLQTGTLSLVQDEALTYLENWNYRYSEGSIAATIADHVYAKTLLRPDSLRQPLGALPTFTERQALLEFDAALAQVSAMHGTSINGWRWTSAFPTRRYFPLWTLSDTLATRSTLRGTGRYAPLEVDHIGHPSTLRYGAAPLLDSLAPANAALRFHASSAPGSAPVLDLPYFDDARLLARYLIADAPSYRQTLRTSGAGRVTLRPASE